LSPSEGERPLVSVITRTYSGRTSKLEAALYSLANQTHPNIEIVVVEDGSNEAHDLVERFRGEGSIMRVHYQAIEKSGRCRAGNVGLAAAQGEFVCFLDDDDLFYADHLEVLVAALLAHPAAGAAYSLAFEVPGDATAASGQDGDASSFRVSVHQPFSRALLWDHNYLPIQSVLFRRSLYLEKGGLDEELDNLEDWNLWIRYSLDVDFFFVEKVTSLYSVPEEGEDAYQRFLRLEDYRARANEKNGQLRVTLSPTEVLAYAQEIERYKTVFALRRSMLRSLALRLPFAGPLFHVLRRAGHALTGRA
jgi:glycosyltransferase involved in cell wall biosynthesis